MNDYSFTDNYICRKSVTEKNNKKSENYSQNVKICFFEGTFHSQNEQYVKKFTFRTQIYKKHLIV